MTIDTKLQANITRQIAKLGRYVIFRSLGASDNDVDWGTQDISYTNSYIKAIVSTVTKNDKWLLMGILQTGDLVAHVVYTQAAKARDMVIVDGIQYTVEAVDEIQIAGTVASKRLALKRKAQGDPNTVEVTIISVHGPITFNGTVYATGSTTAVNIIPGVYVASHGHHFYRWRTTGDISPLGVSLNNPESFIITGDCTIKDK